MLVKMLFMFSFVITLAAGVTTAFMDRLYMCLKMANIVYDHIVYKGSKLESESERDRERSRFPAFIWHSDIFYDVFLDIVVPGIVTVIYFREYRLLL